MNWTATFISAESKECKEWFKNNKDNINLQDVHEMTALHFCSFYGHYGLVKDILQDPDVLVNLQNSAGNSPLHLAVQKNNESICFLVKNI